MKKVIIKKSLDFKKIEISKIYNLNGIYGGFRDLGTAYAPNSAASTPESGGRNCHSEPCPTEGYI